MAKKAEQNKVCDKTGLTLEQNTVYDDNLLPSADELAKLDNVSKRYYSLDYEAYRDGTRCTY